MLELDIIIIQLLFDAILLLGRYFLLVYLNAPQVKKI